MNRGVRILWDVGVELSMRQGADADASAYTQIIRSWAVVFAHDELVGLVVMDRERRR